MKEETTCLPWFPGSCLKRATHRGSQISQWHWTCTCHSLILLTLTCSTVKLCTVSCKNFVVKEKICLKQKIMMKSFIIRYTKHRNNTTSKLCLLVQEKCTETYTHVWVCQQQLELYSSIELHTVMIPHMLCIYTVTMVLTCMASAWRWPESCSSIFIWQSLLGMLCAWAETQWARSVGVATMANKKTATCDAHGLCRMIRSTHKRIFLPILNSLHFRVAQMPRYRRGSS